MQHRLALAIRERHVLQRHRAARLRHGDRFGGLPHGRLLLEHARQLLQRRSGGLEHVVELRQLLQRVEELAQVEHERGQHSQRHLSLREQVPAVQQHRGRREPAEQVDRRPEGRHQRVRPDVGVAVAGVDVLEDLLVARLAPERLHRADAAKRLDVVHDHEHDRHPHRAIGACGVDPEPVREPEHDRHDDERHHAEPQVEVQKDGGDRDHRDHRRDDRGQPRRQQLVQRVDVRGEPGDDAPRRVALVEGQRQLLDMREKHPAQVEQDVGADPPRQAQEQVVSDGVDGKRQQQHADDQHQRAEAPGADASVDAKTDQVRNRQVRRRPNEDQERRQGHTPAVRPGEVDEQRPAAPAQETGDGGRELVDLLGGHSAPGVRARHAHTTASSYCCDRRAR